MDISSVFATQKFSAAKEILTPVAEPEVPKEALSKVQSFADALKATEETAVSAMAGQTDTAALVQAIAQTELAVETVVTVRDKVVQAYQEILRMPI
ncbi:MULTISPECIES: flagellar hook-basal body complex protein FliE [Donghicola]|jgi:flagellar hook-basal body complex protein FliE|uniref:flagellar hook-basal body complex protein FliE n=1 Tax=Donghicola sp. TaxID=1929294 RepID=UPI0025EDCF5B|nr:MULTISPECIES: flagellar hook-basal body complex protein FliE [Donghicola]MCI5041762.1 flagellar hook-basal body complex protein FliE [Donghicola eburneus]MCT4578552.1 flagellar hook-basal body complex protein FliE [Donghicola sp.]